MPPIAGPPRDGLEVVTGLTKGNEADASAPLCAGCRKPIIREGTHALQQPWHKQCLKCVVCNCVLAGDFFEKNGKVYCEADFKATFTPVRCRACGVFVPADSGMSAKGFRWHFCCFTCGWVRCAEHQRPACGGLMCVPTTTAGTAPSRCLATRA